MAEAEEGWCSAGTAGTEHPPPAADCRCVLASAREAWELVVSPPLSLPMRTHSLPHAGIVTPAQASGTSQQHSRPPPLPPCPCRRVVQEQPSAATSTVGGAGNPRWLAPEILKGGPATQAADVYSFGVVLWELLTLELPWGQLPTWSVVGEVLAGQRPPLPPPEACAGFSSYAAYVELLQRCWAQEPTSRPSFEEVCARLR